MLYLARVLHMPGGESVRNMVLRVENGVVNDFYSFAGETHSMLLVNDAFLSYTASLETINDINKISHQCDGEKLYAYRQVCAGGLQLLE